MRALAIRLGSTLALATAALVVAEASRAAGSCAALVPATSATIQISEVEADPALAGTDTANEWLELTNVSATPLTLESWTLTDNGGSDVVPTVTLGPGRCIVVAASSAGFLAEHVGYSMPFVSVADGAIGNGLSNTGDVLTLADANGAAVDCTVWGSGTGCFSPAVVAPAPNTGETIQRAQAVDTDAAADWAVAAESPCATATAVTLAWFRASAPGRGRVLLSWRTAGGPAQVGFHVWRSRIRTSGYRRVTKSLIRARSVGGLRGASYTFMDRVARAAGARTRFYRLQIVGWDGRSAWAGPLAISG